LRAIRNDRSQYEVFMTIIDIRHGKVFGLHALAMRPTAAAFPHRQQLAIVIFSGCIRPSFPTKDMLR
jgi:hypothetical protein